MKKTEAGKATEVKATPAAAEPLKQGKFQMIDIDRLHQSKTNPRKNFDAKLMNDMEASVREKGVLQPLVVRKHAEDVYEIVCGARRWGAAKAAGLKEVPCMVTPMTDQQVIEVQVIENMQRADLTPLEEAKGYQQLHEQYKYDWPEIAARVGKSTGYVFTRLNLLKLIPEFQKALETGFIKADNYSDEKVAFGLKMAEAVVRIQDPEDQKSFYKQMQDSPYDLGLYSGDFDMLEYVKDNFLKQLKNAPFPVKDKDLAGGACGVCPKRTGAQADLFGDLQGKEDTCLDGKCWAAKKVEWLKKLKDKYSDLAAAGHTILVGSAAEQAINARNKYAKLDDTSWNMLKGNTTWGQAIKGTDYKTVIAIDEKGERHEFVSINTAIKYVPESKKQKENMPAAAKSDEQKLEEEMKEQAEKDAAEEISERLMKLAGKLDMNKLNILQLVLYSMSYGSSTKGKDIIHLKQEIISNCFSNDEAETLKVMGLDKDLKGLVKTKLAELKAAAVKKEDDKDADKASKKGSK